MKGRRKKKAAASVRDGDTRQEAELRQRFGDATRWLKDKQRGHELSNDPTQKLEREDIFSPKFSTEKAALLTS